MDKKKIFSSFQKLGKVLMAPVLLLPISGILVGVGSAFTNASLVEVAPFLGNSFFSLIFQLMKDAGNVVNNNISIIFAICIAYWILRKVNLLLGLISLKSFHTNSFWCIKTCFNSF